MIKEPTVNLFTVPNSLTELSSSSLIGRFVRSSLFVHDKVLYSPPPSFIFLYTLRFFILFFVIYFRAKMCGLLTARVHNRWWASIK